MRNAIIILLILIACFAEAGSKKQSMRKYSVFARAGGASTPVPTNGLVAYWSMRASGATVYDEYGTNTGTAVNSPTFGTAYGVKNDGVRFLSASSQDIRATDNASLRITGSMTLAMWVYTPTTNTFQRLLNKGGPTGFRAYGSYLQASTLAPVLQLATDTATLVSYASTIAMSSSSWHHVAMVYSTGSYVKIYQDGVERYSNTTSIPASQFSNNGADFHMGSIDIPATPQYADIYLDEVMVYNRALTSNEVYQIYSTPQYYP